MKKLFLLVILTILVSGCGKYNPCAPDLQGQHVDGPPVLYLSFDDTVKNFVAPVWASVLTWWNDNGATWNGYGPGWAESSDHAHDLAYNFWKSKGGDKKVGIGGICGNFAGFMIYSCRMHGYKTGGVIYYSWDDNGQNCTGHIEAFVQDTDGKVITTSNAAISHYKTFNSLAEMKAAYDSDWNRKNSYCFYVDSFCNEIPKEKLQEYFGN